MARPPKCPQIVTFRMSRAAESFGFVQRAMTTNDLSARFDTLTLSPIARRAEAFSAGCHPICRDHWSEVSGAPFNLRGFDEWRHIHPYLATVHQRHGVAVALQPATGLPRGLRRFVQRSCALPGVAQRTGAHRCGRRASEQLHQIARQPISSWGPSSSEAWRPVRGSLRWTRSLFSDRSRSSSSAVTSRFSGLRHWHAGTALLFSNSPNC